MLTEEHYFENILYTFKNTGDWNKAIADKLSTDNLTQDQIRLIQMCALYVIDNICEWSQENMKKLLSHDLFD